MIEFINATKVYGDNTALDHLNLTINPGEIFGLIGQNGAGKSTTIKSLVGVIDLTEGDVKVDGMSIKDQPIKVKQQIGYVADSPDAFLKMTAVSYWTFIGQVFGVSDEARAQRIDYLCETFEFTDAVNKRIEEMSHGMRQKVFVIGALLSDPKIWVLDEPLTGLDPQSAFNLKNLMKEHTARGNTVLFSTHVLEVAEKLCDRIAIIKKGKLLYLGTMEQLKDKNPGKSLEDIYLDIIKGEAK